MAKLFTTNQGVVNVEPKNGKDFSLEELRGFAGGHIEVIPFSEYYLVCNENGKELGLPVNHVISAFSELLLGHNEIVVGNVLICKNTELL